MIERDNELKVIREWVEKTENDYANAANTLKMGEKCPTDTVCFHAQQCVEELMEPWHKVTIPRKEGQTVPIAVKSMQKMRAI